MPEELEILKKTRVWRGGIKGEMKGKKNFGVVGERFWHSKVA